MYSAVPWKDPRPLTYNTRNNFIIGVLLPKPSRRDNIQLEIPMELLRSAVMTCSNAMHVVMSIRRKRKVAKARARETVTRRSV